MSKEHHYMASIVWTGNKGEGTSTYTGYERSHRISIDGKPVIEASADKAFRGDASAYNPEELFLASLASCHMLWYLHLCADHGIVVTGYEDHPSGTMLEEEKGGHFTEVILHPCVKVRDETMIDKANELHSLAHSNCFIANSCNFPVKHQPVCMASG